MNNEKNSKNFVNVLFTSVGRRVELLRAFKKAYKSLALNGKIIATDVDPLAPGLQEAHEAYIVPPVSDSSYIQALREICERENIKLVFPLIDPDVLQLARNRHELEITGAWPVVVSENAALICADKWLTFKFFQRIGVPTALSWLPEEISEVKPEYPLIVKPRFGSASKQVYVVRSVTELEFFLRYIPDPIIQEYVPGPEVTTDVYCDLTTARVLGVVSRQRIEVRSGEVTKGKTVYNSNIVKHCVTIANELKAVGPLNVQCIVRDNEPYFIEINARFGGGAPLGFAAGVNAPFWFLSLAAGFNIDIPPLGAYRTGLYITRFDDSIYLEEADLAKIASRII
ncbi:MAG: ATP-grasp domain-containing protein [Deltaproteobacteria bacterium]|nr:ATP-grasp domain-containing protein [Deltaproteobacteria bacterium]